MHACLAICMMAPGALAQPAGHSGPMQLPGGAGPGEQGGYAPL